MDYTYYKAHREIFSPSCCLLGLWRINADRAYIRTQKANENLYTQKTLPTNEEDNNYILVALRTLEGEGVLKLNNVTYHLKKDTLIFFKLCQQRQYYSLSDKWSFIWCEFLINYNFFDNNTLYNIENFDEETIFFEKALEVMAVDNSLDTYISSLFATQMTLWNKYAVKENIVLNLTNEQRINNILSFISVNYSDKYLSISQLANMCNLSERRFRTLFFEIVGQSPKKYITSYRMKIACRLLSDNNMTIRQISEKTGFENQSYFCNAFSSIFKMSPTKYIAKNQNNRL